jgi:four helix bundle protein
MGSDEPGYTRLEAFKRSDDLAVAIFPFSRELRSVDRSFASQVFRAAISAPANIAEGYGRASAREFAHFLEIAHGCLFELDYFLHFTSRTELVESPRVEGFRNDCRAASKLVYGLMRSQRAKLQTDAGRRYLREEHGEYTPYATD